MKEGLLNYICSPTTHSPLELVVEEHRGDEIVTGRLCDRISGHEFPIIKGIPRLVLDTRQIYENYAASFGHQWTYYNWERDEDLSEFEAIVDRPLDFFHGMSILDAGCGGGRVSRFLARNASLFIGFDFSKACERAYELCRDLPHAHILQADVNALPLRQKASFDFVFSHGVLHHTPDTKKSFSHLPPLVKPGGQLYVAVFRKTFFLMRFSDGCFRVVFSNLSNRMQEKICRGLLHLQRVPNPVAIKRFFWFSLQKNPEVAACCNYDWYAPRYHHEHTAVEVMKWFAEYGFREIQYINAWPYCPPESKYRIPTLIDSFRLGQLLGVIGTNKG